MSADFRRKPATDRDECQCARCGSSCYFADCDQCGGEGETQDVSDWTLGGLIEEYDRCYHCGGEGGWWVCLSVSLDDRLNWCEANPMPGREDVRNAVEWFTPERAR